MADQQASIQFRQRAIAWSVHLFSASGGVLALLALLAVLRHDWTEAMLWLFAALVVDGIDGTFARAARVREVVPRIDGDALDLVIDYLNYVFVPTFFLLEAGLLSAPLALPLAGLIQIASLYIFARRDMKTADGYFKGFPALWNLVALYLFAAGLGPTATAVVVIALVALTFAPVHVVHPFRVRDFGPVLPILSAVWGVATLALLLVAHGTGLRPLLLAISTASALLLVGMGLWRSVRGPQEQPSAIA